MDTRTTADRLMELTSRYGTDKGPQSITRSSRFGRKHTLTGKGYTSTYARFFAELVDEPIRLLEIGIDRGASIPVWEAFFPHASLAAIDIKPTCRKYESARTKVHIGSQTDTVFLRQVSEISGPFDVVIDDGGHTMDQHEASLKALWPVLAAGGLYVIEDLHTAYRPDFGGGYLSKDSTVEKLKHVIDRLQYRDGPDPLLIDVAGIWFAPGICVLAKTDP